MYMYTYHGHSYSVPFQGGHCQMGEVKDLQSVLAAYSNETDNNQHCMPHAMYCTHTLCFLYKF